MLSQSHIGDEFYPYWLTTGDRVWYIGQLRIFVLKYSLNSLRCTG